MKEDWWDRKAGQLHRMGLNDHPAENPTRDDAYKVALHTRQDVVLIVSYLSSLNQQAYHIKLLLGAIFFVLIYAVFR